MEKLQIKVTPCTIHTLFASRMYPSERIVLAVEKTAVEDGGLDREWGLGLGLKLEITHSRSGKTYCIEVKGMKEK